MSEPSGESHSGEQRNAAGDADRVAALEQRVDALAEALRHTLAAIDVLADHLEAVVPAIEDHVAEADRLRRRARNTEGR